VKARLVACLVLLARVASADDVADLVASGEELAKQGEWSRAIDAFKAADAKHPRAKHACLIGLAYTRRELWGEAELFLSICQQRASTDDPAPEWLAEAQHTLADKLAAAGAAPVTIAVAPSEAIAMIGVSSFAPGETFTPRTIHLPPGTYTITVSAPGYKPERRELTIAGGAPQDLKVALVSEHPPSRSGSRLPLYLIAAGGALALGGLAYDELAVQPLIADMKKSNAAWDANVSELHTRQDITIGLWAGAAVAVAGGIVLHYVTGRDVGVTAGVDSRGAVVGLTWRR